MRQVFIVVTLFCALDVYAQNVGINTTGAAPHNSAMLDIDANNRGLLIPRVALTGTNDVTTITSPATSLLIYNTATTSGPNAVSPGYYYWNGSSWVRIAIDSDNWKLTGNSGTSPTTNFLGTTDANDFQIRVNNISKIHIRNDLAGTNRIGIGTNFATVYTPGATPTLLHVHDGETGANDFALITLGSSKSTATNKIGEIHFAATGVASTDRRTAGIESFLTAVHSGPNVSGDLRFFANNQGTYEEKVRIQPNGRVGIGILTPQGQLDVVQTTNNPTLLVSNYGNVNNIHIRRAQGTLASPSLIGINGVLGRLNAQGFDGSDFQTAAQIAFEVDATSGTGDMPGRITFSTTADNTTTLIERMRITNAGNVGIGTNNPLRRLHVVDGGGIAASSTTTSAGITSSANTWANHDIFVYSNTGEHPALVGLRARGTFSSPSYPQNQDILLSVTSRDAIDGYSSLNYGGATIDFMASENWSSTAKGAVIRFLTTSNGSNVLTERARFTNQGNFLIGTNTAGARLHVVHGGQNVARIVAGTSFMNDWPAGWGGGIETWDICGASTYMTTYATRSDIRYKSNINNINSSLEEVKKLRPVSYYMNPELESDKKEHLHFGFIAQEIEKIFPNLVVTTTNGYKGMNYQELIPILTKAIQEQQAIIEKQDKEIESLQNAKIELDLLRREVDLIKAQINFQNQYGEK